MRGARRPARARARRRRYPSEVARRRSASSSWPMLAQTSVTTTSTPRRARRGSRVISILPPRPPARTRGLGRSTDRGGDEGHPELARRPSARRRCCCRRRPMRPQPLEPASPLADRLQVGERLAGMREVGERVDPPGCRPRRRARRPSPATRSGSRSRRGSGTAPSPCRGSSRRGRAAVARPRGRARCRPGGRCRPRTRPVSSWTACRRSSRPFARAGAGAARTAPAPSSARRRGRAPRADHPRSSRRSAAGSCPSDDRASAARAPPAGAADAGASPTCFAYYAQNCIICRDADRRDPRLPPATPARRRSTACSRTRSSRSSRSARTRSRASRASALDVRLNGSACRRFVHERGGARGGRRRRLRLPRPRGGRRARAAGRRASSSTSPARTGSHDAALYPEWYGFEHPHPAALADWSYALPELLPPDGRADREPRAATRPRRCSRSRRSPDAIDPASVVVDAKSGVSGAGRELKASLARGLRARERLAVPRRDAPARAGDRAGARLPGLLRPAPAARAPRACSPPVTRRPLDGDLRELLEDAYAASPSCACCPRASRPSSRACSTPTRAEIGAVRGPRDGHARSSSARSTTSARAPPARPSRTRTSRSASTRRSACGSQGVLV